MHALCPLIPVPPFFLSLSLSAFLLDTGFFPSLSVSSGTRCSFQDEVCSCSSPSDSRSTGHARLVSFQLEAIRARILSSCLTGSSGIDCRSLLGSFEERIESRRFTGPEDTGTMRQTARSGRVTRPIGHIHSLALLAAWTACDSIDIAIPLIECSDCVRLIKVIDRLTCCFTNLLIV